MPKAKSVGALIVGTGHRRGPGSLKRVKHHMHPQHRADFVAAVQQAYIQPIDADEDG